MTTVILHVILRASFGSLAIWGQHIFAWFTNLAISSIIQAVVKVSFSIQPTMSLAEVSIFSVTVYEVLLLSTFSPGFYKATNLRFLHISIRVSTRAFITSVI